MAVLHLRVLASSAVPHPLHNGARRELGLKAEQVESGVVMVMGLLHGPAGTQASGVSPLLQGRGVGVLRSMWRMWLGWLVTVLGSA